MRLLCIHCQKISQPGTPIGHPEYGFQALLVRLAETQCTRVAQRLFFFHSEEELALWHIMTVHELPDLYGTSWNINYLLCRLATHAVQAGWLKRGMKMGANRSRVEQTAVLDRKELCAGYFLALSDMCI